MKTKLLGLLSLLLLASPVAFANDVYITQSGASLDLDIVQDGQNNKVGNSTTDAVLSGASMKFSVTQTGSSNVLQADVVGDNIDVDVDVTGSTNDIVINCDASASKPGGASGEDLPLRALLTISAARSASFASFVDLNVSIPRAMILPRRSEVANLANRASRRFDTASVFRQMSSRASTRLCLFTRGSCTGGGCVNESEPYAGGLIFVEDGCSAAS